MSTPSLPSKIPRTPRRIASVSSQSATANHLSVVRGHIQFPDLRIEYEDARGQSGRVDVELTTDHYKKGQIAAKAAAGFTLYSLGGDSSGGGSGVREERELTSQILSL